MTERVIIAHWTLEEARKRAKWEERHGGGTVVAIVSPRTLDRLRGVVADRLVLAGGISTDAALTTRISQAARPCFATSSNTETETA